MPKQPDAVQPPATGHWPPATGLDTRNPPRQFVRKLSGLAVPSKGGQAAFDMAFDTAFDAAFDGFAASAHRLVARLVTGAEPKDATSRRPKRVRWADRLGTAQR